MTLPRLALARRLQITAVAATSICALTTVRAETAPDGRWHGNTALGGAFSSGNTSSTTLTLAADTSKATAADKISLAGLVNYGRTEINGRDTTTADQAWLRGRYDYNLSRDMFAFGGVGVETNEAAGTQSRYSLSVGAGYKVIRTATTSFDVFGGVGYSGVNFTNDTSASGGELLFGEESIHKLSDTTSVRQRFEYRPGQGGLGNLATFTASLATAIVGGWTLNVGMTAQYASIVPQGSKSTDVLMTVGFGYKF